MTHSNTPKPYEGLNLPSLHIRGNDSLYLALDGIPLKEIKSFTVEESPNGVAKLTITLHIDKINADLDFDGFTEIFNSLTLDNKELVLRELRDLIEE